MPLFFFASSTRRSRSATAPRQDRALPAGLLRRLRDRRPVRRADPRQPRRAAGGRARLRARRRRLLPLGGHADQPSRLAVVLDRPRRGRGRPRARPGQHRRRSTGRRAAATARRPGSRRRCATSASASASRCSARPDPPDAIEREGVAGAPARAEAGRRGGPPPPSKLHPWARSKAWFATGSQPDVAKAMSGLPSIPRAATRKPAASASTCAAVFGAILPPASPVAI